MNKILLEKVGKCWYNIDQHNNESSGIDINYYKKCLDPSRADLVIIDKSKSKIDIIKPY
jgi:hypothetical protein